MRFALFIVTAVTAASCVPSGGPPDSSEVEEAFARLQPAVTKAERDDFIEQCLQDKGSVVFNRRPTGGFDGQNVTASDEQAMTDCVAESFERWPNPPQPATRADYEVLYNLYLRQVDCLRDIGFAMDPPSLEAYIDGGGFWIPYEDLPPPGSSEDWEAVNMACPQDPWSYADRS